MTINTTRWTPDTCACVIEYTWDSDSSEDDRVHSFARLVSACAAHQHLDESVSYAHVVHENVTKNLVHAAIVEHAPDARFEHEHRGRAGQRELLVTVDADVPAVVVDHKALAGRLRSHGVAFDTAMIPKVSVVHEKR